MIFSQTTEAPRNLLNLAKLNLIHNNQAHNVVKRQKSELQHWKSTHRALFALGIVASTFICIRFVFPNLLKVTWQGSFAEEMTFIALIWFVSTLIIGMSTLAVTLFAIGKTIKKLKSQNQEFIKEDQKLDREKIARESFSGLLPRWLMSLSCLGPPLALAILANPFHQQLPLGDGATLAKACSLLGLVFFVLTLPLSIDAQRSLNARMNEKFGDGSE